MPSGQPHTENVEKHSLQQKHDKLTAKMDSFGSLEWLERPPVVQDIQEPDEELPDTQVSPSKRMTHSF